MPEVVIQPLKNGPYLVKGPVTLVDSQGQPIPSESGEPVALCRCGHSSSKPFCDGSHKKTGFQG